MASVVTSSYMCAIFHTCHFHRWNCTVALAFIVTYVYLGLCVGWTSCHYVRHYSHRCCWPWTMTLIRHHGIAFQCSNNTHHSIARSMTSNISELVETRQLWRHDGPSRVYGDSSPLVFIRVHNSDSILKKPLLAYTYSDVTTGYHAFMVAAHHLTCL